MLNCLFNGKRICSLDTKNRFDKYIYDEVERLKEAGQQKKLICEECGNYVFLRSGDVKIPHFAHISGVERDCYFDRNETKETEEHRMGKSILYNYFKDKYEDANVYIDYKHKNGRRSNIYIEFKSGERLVVEFQRNDLKVTEWKKRNYDYTDDKTNIIWILSSKEYNRKRTKTNTRLSFFEEMMIYRGSNNILILLDTDSSLVKLAKIIQYIDYETGELVDEKIFELKYKLNDILILPNGQVECDFNESFNKAKKEFFNLVEEKKKKENIYKNINNNSTTQYQNYYKPKRKVEKSLDELQKEVELNMIKFPRGPWYDSSRDERWGFCKCCDKLTKDWVSFDGATNECICRDCDKNIL